ncbi:hypothetical protein J6590_022439 [Homalodisca vitripennis]|nr:hypothetical protein J6590_022439 [Homalodisca vitripennis]
MSEKLDDLRSGKNQSEKPLVISLSLRTIDDPENNPAGEAEPNGDDTSSKRPCRGFKYTLAQLTKAMEEVNSVKFSAIKECKVYGIPKVLTPEEENKVEE